jgi:hypothetical protein
MFKHGLEIVKAATITGGTEEGNLHGPVELASRNWENIVV